MGNSYGWGHSTHLSFRYHDDHYCPALIEDGHRQVGGEKGQHQRHHCQLRYGEQRGAGGVPPGKGSGWMGTLNGWCTNLALPTTLWPTETFRTGIPSTYGTPLTWKDIGCDFDATDASLESLTLMVNDRIDPDRFVTEKETGGFQRR